MHQIYNCKNSCFYWNGFYGGVSHFNFGRLALSVFSVRLQKSWTIPQAFVLLADGSKYRGQLERSPEG
jgi:hypothetical protein